LEEVAVCAGHRVLMEVDDTSTLIADNHEEFQACSSSLTQSTFQI